MKAIHIVYSGLGGASSLVFSLIEADKKKRLKQEIIFTGPSILKDHLVRSKNLKINYYWIKTIKLISFFFLYKVFVKILSSKPDIIFLHNYFIIPCVIYKLFFKKIKIIYINHTDRSYYHWRDNIIFCFKKYISNFVVLNKSTYNFYVKNLKFPKTKVKIISNGVNVNFFSRKFLKRKKFFKIGMACRVNKKRNYELIVDTLNTKLLKNLNIKFSLAGTGEELKNFNEKIQRQKINHKVRTEGLLNQEELKRWYNSLDVYIHASYGEGNSISILQAMAMKIPVLGSNVPGINNILESKKNLGLLFNNNVKDLSEKINFFYNLKKNRRDKFTNIQYNFIQREHNFKKTFAKYLSIIINEKISLT